MSNYRNRQQRKFAAGLLLAFLSVFVPGASASTATEIRPCATKVPPEQQIQLGRKVSQQVYKEQPVLPDNSPATQYVRSLGQKLAPYAPGAKWPFTFHVVNAADINAFALPGGEVFVNLGTIQAAGTEAQLAAVIAHEMSHVVLQHSICNMEKQQKVGLIAGIGQIAAGIALGGGVLGNIAQQGIGLGAGLGFLKMSRGAEKEADLEGVKILYDAGYDPRGMPQFFETIEGKYGKGGAQFLSDHPNPGNRSDYVNEEIQSLPPKQHYVTNTDSFRQIQKQVSGMRAYTAKEIASGEWKRKDPNQTVSTGINQYDLEAPAVDLSTSGNWSTFKGDGFTMQVPSSWRALGDQRSAMIAPQGGIGMHSDDQQANLMYGVLTDVYTPEPGTSADQAFRSLLEELSSQNPGMQPSSIDVIRVSGRNAGSSQSITRDSNNGRGEHDWIVGIPSENYLRYFVFVAPESDFRKLQPTFEKILSSIRLE